MNYQSAYQKKTYLIRSADRNNVATSDSSNCVVNLPDVLPAGRYRVVTAVIPNYVYNVDANCAKIYFRSGSTNYVATLSNGFYTSSTLATAVQTVMNAQLAGFTVTLDSDSKRLTFANASSFYFNWSAAATTTTGYDDCAALLGFRPLTDSGSAATSVTAPNPINLTRCQALVMRLAEAATGLSTSDANRRCYAALYWPLIDSFGSFSVYDQTKYIQLLNVPSDVKNLNITICTARGTQISLNGADWEIVLEQICD